MRRRRDVMERLRKIIDSPYFMAALFVMKMVIYYGLIEANQLEIVLIIISLAVWALIFTLFARSGLKRKRGSFFAGL